MALELIIASSLSVRALETFYTGRCYVHLPNALFASRTEISANNDRGAYVVLIVSSGAKFNKCFAIFSATLTSS